MPQRRIRITAVPVVMEAELNQSRTAQQIWDALPIEGPGNMWGDEIYFSIPINAETDNAQAVVELGELAYWPPRHGILYLLWSHPDEPRHRDSSREPCQCCWQVAW